MWLLVVSFSCLCCLGRSTRYNNPDVVQEYIIQVVKEFQKEPRHSRFSGVIQPPQIPMSSFQRAQFFLPKLFIWSPQEQYECRIKCTLHRCNVRETFLTDRIIDDKRSPRMIYDMGGNVLLIQRVYRCYGTPTGHRILSTAESIMLQLPRRVQAGFPFIFCHRSGCTKNIANYIWTAVVQGVNFRQISEGIASLNYQEYCQKGIVFKAALGDEDVCEETEPFEPKQFFQDALFSFPSNDNVMYLFLRDFSEKKELLFSSLHSVPFTSISCDHTFKVSRNIGIVREIDGKFITQFKNLFIVLNEHGQVLAWRLSATTSFDEIYDLLINIKERNRQASPEGIYVDDCCKVRAKYQSIFGDCSIKLDLFHACQRVLKTLSFRQAHFRKFTKEFGLIFRVDGDDGANRLKCTPTAEKLEGNLNSFMERWSYVPDGPMNKNTFQEIEKLRIHIKKGCLSGIPPGFGTTRNEHLHSLLNRSLMVGTARMSVELAVAILSVLFFHYNSKKTSKSEENGKHVVPCMPVEGIRLSGKFREEASSKTFHPVKYYETTKAESRPDTAFESENEANEGEAFVLVSECVHHLCNKESAKAIINEALSRHKLLATINSQCSSRAFDAFDIPYLNSCQMLGLLTPSDTGADLPDDGLLDINYERLDRHLKSFSLKRDSVPGDGDCAFRSIIRQLHKLILKDEEVELKKYLNQISLGKSEDEDTFTLRQQFSDGILDFDPEIVDFINYDDVENLIQQAREFKEPGVFNYSLGDVVMKWCSMKLRVSVIVVSSSVAAPYVPFIPEHPVSSQAIYVAHVNCGPGHYDGTDSLGE